MCSALFKARGGLGVPRVWRRHGHIHLKRPEATTGNAALQCETNCQSDVALGDGGLPDEREREVVTGIFGGGTLEIRACRSTAFMRIDINCYLVILLVHVQREDTAVRPPAKATGRRS